VHSANIGAFSQIQEFVGCTGLAARFHGPCIIALDDFSTKLRYFVSGRQTCGAATIRRRNKPQVTFVTVQARNRDIHHPRRATIQMI